MKLSRYTLHLDFLATDEVDARHRAEAYARALLHLRSEVDSHAATVSRPRTVTVGDVLRLAAADYCYGTGDLTIRVTDIGADLTRYPTLEWVRIRGVAIRGDGQDGTARDILVRVAALATAKQKIS